MKQTNPTPGRIASAVIALAALATVGTLAADGRGDVLIRQSFDAAAGPGLPAGPQPVGSVGKYEGPAAGPLGAVSVVTVATPAGPTRALQVTNVAHPENRSPAINLKWAAPSAGVLRVGYRFMTPIDGRYLSVHYFGGDWKTAAAVFMVGNGTLTLQYGEKDARVQLGTYTPGVWQALRLDFDVAARTVSVFLDGQKKADALPWQANAATPARADLFADFTNTDHKGAPVLYVDDVTVEAVPPGGVPAAAPAAAPPAERKSVGRAFRYGVCAHVRWGKPEDFGRLIDAIDRLGVDVVRDGVEWNTIEPADGKWDFAAMDGLVDALNARGVELETLLGFSARWASTGDPNAKDWLDWNRVAPRPGPWADYVKTMVGRYRDRIKLWEIWNEEDIGFWRSTPAQYAELFNATSADIANADPKAVVLNGGFALNRRPPNVDFMQDFLRDADPSHWNLWAYHDYHTFGQMIGRAKENARLYDSKRLDIPVWVNEGGFHTLLAGGEQEQAVTLAKKLATAPSLGIGGYIWYDLIDDGEKPLDPEHHFGLLRHDFSPKPAYAAYRQLIGELAPRHFDKRLPESADLPGLWGLVYRAASPDQDDVLVLWREGKGRATPVWVGGNGAATGVRAIDGAAVDAPALNGGLLVSVSDAPAYVRLRHGSAPVVKPVLASPERLAVLPGHDNKLSVRVTNPTTAAATFAVSIAAAPGARAPQVQTLRLTPGQSATVEAAVAVASGAGQGAVVVTLKAGDGGAAIEARVPYAAALALPRVADGPAVGLPDGVGVAMRLDTTESVVNLFSAEPNDAMHWHGPADQSAVARAAYSDDALRLTVDVTDDTHRQDAVGEAMWEGDSLQLGLRVDDSRPAALELAAALGPDGKPHGWVYAVTNGSPLPVGRLDDAVGCDVRRQGTTTRYALRLPWAVLGLKGPPAGGLRLNFLVNDNDGHGRKGWVQLASGIGRDKNPDLFPLFVCDGVK